MLGKTPSSNPVEQVELKKPAEIKEALAPFGIKTVPIVEEDKVLPETIAELVEYSKGKSVVRKEQKREGVVMRNVQSNISFKVINPDFLLAEKD